MVRAAVVVVFHEASVASAHLALLLPAGERLSVATFITVQCMRNSPPPRNDQPHGACLSCRRTVHAPGCLQRYVCSHCAAKLFSPVRRQLRCVSRHDVGKKPVRSAGFSVCGAGVMLRCGESLAAGQAAACIYAPLPQLRLPSGAASAASGSSTASSLPKNCATAVLPAPGRAQGAKRCARKKGGEKGVHFLNAPLACCSEGGAILGSVFWTPLFWVCRRAEKTALARRVSSGRRSPALKKPRRALHRRGQRAIH